MNAIAARPPTRPREPATPSLDAFRVHRLAEAVRVAQARVDAAQRALADARSAPDRNKARRALRQAKTGLTAAERSLSAENRGEQAAPAVQRLPVVQDGVVLRDARIDTTMRAQIVTALDRLRSRRSISEAQALAGRRYRAAYEMAHADLYPIGFGGDGGRSAPSSGNRRVEQSVACSLSLAQMRARLTGQAVTLLEHVIIHDLTVEAWALRQINARGRAMSAEQAMGMLVLALDVVGRVE